MAFVDCCTKCGAAETESEALTTVAEAGALHQVCATCGLLASLQELVPLVRESDRARLLPLLARAEARARQLVDARAREEQAAWDAAQGR